MNRLPPLLGDGRRVLLARLVLWGLLQGAVSVGAARLVHYAFSRTLRHAANASDMALLIAAGFVVLALILMAIRVLERSDAEALGQRYAAALRINLFRALMRASARSVQEKKRGHLMLRFIGDLTSLRTWVSLGLARLVVSGVAISAASAALWFVNPVLSLTILGVLTMIAVALAVLGPILRGRIRIARRLRGRIAGNIGEKLGGMATIQAHGRPHRELNRLRRQNAELVEAAISRARFSALIRSLPEVGMMIATGIVLLLSLTTFAGPMLRPGTVFAALVLLGILGSPLADLARVFDYRQNYCIGREKVLSILTLPPRYRIDDDLISLEVDKGGEITFDQTRVGNSLGPISVAAPAGATVAIVGHNGAGKSTLLTLAAALIAPDEGAVLIDGTELATCSPASIRRQVSIVSRDVPLLRGTIGSNLKMRRPSASEEEIWRACDLCGLGERLRALPDGFKTAITEGGASLPAGLRQRIALVRAILDDPAVLLLDETDAELDDDGQRILDRLVAERQGTTLMVTHDAARAARADAIWFLSGGRLIEVGTPSELLARGGVAAAFLRPVHVAPSDRAVRAEQHAMHVA